MNFKCPACGSHICKEDIKKRFVCSSCGENLKSNIKSVESVYFIFYTGLVLVFQLIFDDPVTVGLLILVLVFFVYVYDNNTYEDVIIEKTDEPTGSNL